jgi:agmatine deiminase
MFVFVWQRDARGERLQVVKMPAPKPMRRTAAEAAGTDRSVGDKLAGSYVNFYLPNGGVGGLRSCTNAACRRLLALFCPLHLFVRAPKRPSFIFF